MERYRGRRIALLTQHGKETVIAPAFARGLGAHVERVTGIDTDTLGTFTRDIPRPGTQLEAARAKARLGMQRAGEVLGVASEGSFGSHPTAWIPWNIEIIVFLDATTDFEVVGVAQGPAAHDHREVSDEDALLAFARNIGFPDQGVVLRPEHTEHSLIRKDLLDEASLVDTFHELRRGSCNGLVIVEHDLRAHRNPLRMHRIGLAVDDLLHRLKSPCPSCGHPGFGRIRREGGRLCAQCGSPTEVARFDVMACPSCNHQLRSPLPDAMEPADPSRCHQCNP